MLIGRNRRHFFLNCPLNAGPVQQVFEWGKVGGGWRLKRQTNKMGQLRGGGGGGNPGTCFPG